jgi:hypothetical protein
MERIIQLKKIVLFISLFNLTGIVYSQNENSENKKEFNFPVTRETNELPAECKTGLNEPGFYFKGFFYHSSLGEHVQLSTDIIMGTANDPSPRFHYTWIQDGEQYGDNEIGREPFYTIKPRLSGWRLKVRIVGPNGEVEEKMITDISTIYYPWVKGKSDLSKCNIDVIGIYCLAYTDETRRAFNKAITNFKNRQPKSENGRPALETNSNQKSSSENFRNQSSQLNSKEVQDNTASTQPQQIQNQKQPSQTQKPALNQGKLTENERMDDKIKGLVRDENGNFWVKLPNGTLAQLDDEQNADFKIAYAKSQADNAKSNAETAKREREQQIQNQIDQLKLDQENRAKRASQVQQDLNSVSNVLIQNFYQGEAARQGWDKIYELSIMSGNYQSVNQIEQIYRSNYTQISQEANSISNARWGNFTNGIATLKTISDPMAAGIGGGVLAVGTMISSANADKKEREAKERLLAERNEAIFQFKTKRKNIRMRIFDDFPEGGTPLEQHKITSPDVYFIAYYIDTSTLFEEKPKIIVSYVFSIPKERDGSYMFKSSLMKKVKNTFGMNAIIVGYFIQESVASDLRGKLIELATLADYEIQEVQLKFKTSTDVNNEGSNDFWGLSEQPKIPQSSEVRTNNNNNKNNKSIKKQKEQVNDDFWEISEPIKKQINNK